MGRPSKYQEDFPERLIAWFSGAKTQRQIIGKLVRYDKEGNVKSEDFKYKVVPADMPTFAGFAFEIGVSHDTLLRWATERVSEEEDAEYKHPEFCVAYNVCKEKQKTFLIDNALQGNSPPASFIFVAKNVTDMTDKQIIETKDQDYKDKQDALTDWFNTIRQHTSTRPADTAGNEDAGEDIPPQ